MNDSVVVQIRWGDAARPGQRTLAVEGASLDEVRRRIAGAFETRRGRTGKPESGTAGAGNRRESGRGVERGGRAAEPARARAGQGSDGDGTAAGAPLLSQAATEAAVGTVAWVSDLPAGRFGPQATLVQVRVGDRTVLLRLPGMHVFASGMRVEVEGDDEGGSFFLAEVLSGAVRGRAVRLTERIL